MRNLVKVLSILFFFSIYSLSAQKVVKKDTLSGTELVITMDAKVNDALSSLEDKCSKVTVSKSSEDGDFISKPVKVYVPNRELTNAEICRQNPKILGYKIQIAVVKSNEEANEVKAYFRKRFPNLKVETDASLRPNYKILAGSYFTKKSASSDLSNIKEYFNSAVPVQYRIFCAEAK